MPYKLEKVTPAPEAPLTGRLESFFLYYDFVVAAGGAALTVNHGYFAVYFSSRSGDPPYKRPQFGQTQFKLTDAAGNTFSVKNVNLLENRAVEYGNETSCLSLFDFDPNFVGPAWFAGGGWAPAFTAPVRSADARPLLTHTVSFESNPPVAKRYAFAVPFREDHNGTRCVGLVLPFLSNPLFGSLLALHTPAGNPGPAVPTLTITTRDNPWNYFNVAPPGAITGYAMIAQGAFKAIELSAEIEGWLIPPGEMTHAQFLDKLSGVVHSYPRLTRTLETADVTSDNATVPPSPDGPVEVLFLDGLNTVSPVPPVY